MVLETKIWALGMIIVIGVSLHLGSLSGLKKEIYVYTLTYLCTHSYKYLYMEPFVYIVS